MHIYPPAFGLYQISSKSIYAYSVCMRVRERVRERVCVSICDGHPDITLDPPGSRFIVMYITYTVIECSTSVEITFQMKSMNSVYIEGLSRVSVYIDNSGSAGEAQMQNLEDVGRHLRDCRTAEESFNTVVWANQTCQSP
jgi:hypothetical protein